MDTDGFRHWLGKNGPQSARVRSDVISRCRRAEKFYGLDLDDFKTSKAIQQFDRDIYLNSGNIFRRVQDVVRARNHMRYALAYYWRFRKIAFEPELKYLKLNLPHKKTHMRRKDSTR
jgi:hypothetical protein